MASFRNVYCMVSLAPALEEKGCELFVKGRLKRESLNTDDNKPFNPKYLEDK